MFEEKVITVDLKNKTDSQGNRYENLNSKEIDKFCGLFENNEDIKAMGRIYESKVPRIFYDVEAVVRSMRSKYTGGA